MQYGRAQERHGPLQVNIMYHSPEYIFRIDAIGARWPGIIPKPNFNSRNIPIFF